MSEPDRARPPAGDAEERPGLIEAVPVRHPWRWVAVAVIAVLTAMLLNLLLTNPIYNWPFVFEAMIQEPVIRGLLIGTLGATVLGMVFGVLGGVLLAVMRLSENPVLRGVSWVYTWFFRAIPRYVLIVTMGVLGALFPEGISLGVPFDWLIIDALGLSGDWRFVTLDAYAVFGGYFGAVLALASSEAAYMAEIARSGILSVDRGQVEAAQALGMSPGLAMRRIILPQAMRVIIPPTGNELISMLKDTSLLTGLPLTTELFFQMQSIGSRTFQTFPVLVGATLYYLALSSVLMVGQAWVERRFGRGVSPSATPRQRTVVAPAAGDGSGAQ
ncbi:amino acid ABC transporter permease [Desertihabitans brevis]|uniref:Amino acid ABC transporter permease n=1 Tax=Desertihabitans brevis TaxID=2268447 RepID=A0A367YYN2_9ACTN|nr:amino acid ABC transporter permease [Desertihabitans brevis]RCK71023.1 amino acid ABC transporter permease [Desertihabitans brevis]